MPGRLMCVCWLALASITMGCIGAGAPAAGERFAPAHVARIRSVRSVNMAPDGSRIAYLLSVPRRPFVDDNGPAHSELHVVATAGGPSRPFISGAVNIGNVAWTPDGQAMSFLAKRGDDDDKCLYIIPADGGESRKALAHDTSISDYSWSPDGRRLAFLARKTRPKEDQTLDDQGFNAVIYEEQLRPTHVWIGEVHLGHPGDFPEEAQHRLLDLPGSAVDVRWSPDGQHLAVVLSPTPLTDDRYMRSKIHIVNVATGQVIAKLDTPGKLGGLRWSPDGQRLAVIAAADLNDPAEGRLLVAHARTGQLLDVLPDFNGHVRSVCWQDAEYIMYLADEGVWTSLAKVSRDGATRKTLVPAAAHVLGSLDLSRDGQHAALIGQAPRHAAEVYTMQHGDGGPRRLTDSNPWFEHMRFAPQEVVTYYARDGLQLEGILIRPLDHHSGQPYPLILAVHGGPEAHIPNGWLTYYSRPGQVGAARGFAVFYPNYRGSTGRGVAFSKMGQGDYGGAEFDDLIDAVDHLVEIGVVDRERVGISGGSYGGYAAAWCATYHSERFKASVMFAGVSDHASKFGTTDIPNEMYLVHARKWPWEEPELFRQRSPLTYAEKCRTPILIVHGQQDTRVDPSQAMALYRHLKTLGQVPVRLVLYPDEGHGNRRAAARLDYNMRLLRWMEHYLKGPGGTLPAYELDYDAVRPPAEPEEAAGDS